MPFDDLQFQSKPYDGPPAYSQLAHGPNSILVDFFNLCIMDGQNYLDLPFHLQN